MNDCPRMKCPSTCAANGDCKWDFGSSYCYLPHFCDVTLRNDGTDVVLSGDKKQLIASSDSAVGYAITCTTSAHTSDWYYRLDVVVDPSYMIFGIAPFPFNMSMDIYTDTLFG